MLFLNCAFAEKGNFHGKGFVFTVLNCLWLCFIWYGDFWVKTKQTNREGRGYGNLERQSVDELTLVVQKNPQGLVERFTKPVVIDEADGRNSWRSGGI